MSALEIVIYSLLGAVIVGLLIKWLIYDKFFKKKKPKNKKTKEDEENAEDTEDTSKPKI